MIGSRVRFKVAAMMAAGIMSGLPVSPDDVLDETEESIKEQNQVFDAVAKISYRMADALIKYESRIF